MDYSLQVQIQLNEAWHISVIGPISGVNFSKQSNSVLAIWLLTSFNLYPLLGPLALQLKAITKLNELPPFAPTKSSDHSQCGPVPPSNHQNTPNQSPLSAFISCVWTFFESLPCSSQKASLCGVIEFFIPCWCVWCVKLWAKFFYIN